MARAVVGWFGTPRNTVPLMGIPVPSAVNVPSLWYIIPAGGPPATPPKKIAPPLPKPSGESGSPGNVVRITLFEIGIIRITVFAQHRPPSRVSRTYDPGGLAGGLTRNSTCT